MSPKKVYMGSRSSAALGSAYITRAPQRRQRSPGHTRHADQANRPPHDGHGHVHTRSDSHEYRRMATRSQTPRTPAGTATQAHPHPSSRNPMPMARMTNSATPRKPQATAAR